MTDPKSTAQAGHGCCGGRGKNDQDKAIGQVKDPVCGMTVDPAVIPHHAHHQGQDYHFCSAGCQAKFVADPARYLEPATEAAAPAAARACCGGGKSTGTEKDPVCGMDVDPQSTAHHADHAGHGYHFCSAGCRAKFVANPAAYLSSAPRPEVQATPGAMWTCPMHPEIRRDGPGTCPI